MLNDEEKKAYERIRAAITEPRPDLLLDEKYVVQKENYALLDREHSRATMQGVESCLEHDIRELKKDLLIIEGQLIARQGRYAFRLYRRTEYEVPVEDAVEEGDIFPARRISTMFERDEAGRLMHKTYLLNIEEGRLTVGHKALDDVEVEWLNQFWGEDFFAVITEMPTSGKHVDVSSCKPLNEAEVERLNQMLEEAEKLGDESALMYLSEVRQRFAVWYSESGHEHALYVLEKEENSRRLNDAVAGRPDLQTILCGRALDPYMEYAYEVYNSNEWTWPQVWEYLEAERAEFISIPRYTSFKGFKSEKWRYDHK